MKSPRYLSVWLAAAATVGMLSGCATQNTTHTLKTPDTAVVETPAQTVESSGKPKTVTELLRSAQEAFEEANKAQEKGDKEAALKHYTRMLEYMTEANLDPGVFYNLRSEFKRILDRSKKHAGTADGGEKVEEFAGQGEGGLNIEFPVDERVLAEIEEIQNLYPKNFQGGLDRSSKYLPYVREEFAKAGLPQDLVWLAQVESQFAPWVTSTAGAGGMWQFMRSTGTRFGLRVDDYVDERYNWQKATRAAVGYLKQLNERFDGSWPLAITAYNMGEGGVEKAVASTDERNLWRLLDTPPASEMMRMETKKFYPKLLATIIVAKSPDRFGFSASSQTPEPIAKVTVSGSYSLAALERAAGLGEGTLRQLNPDLTRRVTPPRGDFELTVPAGTEEQLTAILNDLPQVRPDSGRGKRTYTVRRGETLATVAKKCGVSVEDLAHANRIRVDQPVTSGRKLVLPVGDDALLDARSTKGEPEKPQEKADTPKNRGSVYTVKKGDTIYDIAKAKGVSVENIVKWNNLSKAGKVSEGDQLRLSSIDEMADEAVKAAAEATHTVQNGETPAKIAKLYGVKVEELLEWNKLSKVSTIAPGDKLVVKGAIKAEDAPAAERAPAEQAPAEKVEGAAETAKAGKSAAIPSGAKKTVHAVAKGESAAFIADKYGVSLDKLLGWNNLTDKSVIKVGDQIAVYTEGEGQKAAEKPAAEKPAAEKPAEKAPVKVAAKASEAPKPAAAAPAKKQEKQEKAAPATKDTEHVVVKGESPSSIAGKYGVKISDLYAWNGLKNAATLQPGQKLVIKK